MLTVEIDEQTPDGKELLIEIHKRSNAVREIYTQKRNEVPRGYMTAEEWLSRSKKNISEIFRKHEQGLL